MSTTETLKYPKAIAVLPKKYQDFYDESCLYEEHPVAAGITLEKYRGDVARAFRYQHKASANRKPVVETNEIEHRKNEIKDGNWIKVQKDITRQSKLKKSLRGPLMLLIYFLEHRPWGGKVDRHQTQRYWYNKKKLIVASRSVKKMSEDLGVGVSTIKRWIRALKIDGLIQVVKENGENVYVIGKVVDGADIFFYELDDKGSDVIPNRGQM